MKKILGNTVVAWVVLVLTVAGACFLGISRKGYFEEKKKTELLKVTKGNWVCDNADILSDDTERDVMERDRVWTNSYNTVAAVATLPGLNRWSAEDYAVALGKKWGLSENALLLLLVKDGECYLAAGAGVDAYLTSQEKNDLINSVYTECNAKNYDGAVTAFLDWAEEKISAAHLPQTYEEFDFGSFISNIFPFSRGCGGGSFKTILIVVVVIIIISALSKGGRARSTPVNRGPAARYGQPPQGPRPSAPHSGSPRPQGGRPARRYASGGKR